MIPLNLLSLFLVPTIFACSVDPGSTLVEDNYSLSVKYWAIALVIFVFTIFLYLKKGRRGLLAVIIGFGVVLLTFLSNNAGRTFDCGFGAVEFARNGILVAAICLLFQLISYLKMRNNPSIHLK